MPKIDIEALPWTSGSNYPAPYDQKVAGRARKRLGNAGGLDQYGVNLTRLEPGAWSALRHWHEREDEFIYMLSGELALIEDEGETRLCAGDAAAFKAGMNNGHHLVNKSAEDAVYLEIGARHPQERAHYPDDDLAVNRRDGAFIFTRKDGGEI